MRINRIKLRNYRKFRHAEVEFGNGIISINGLNGAGKSTLVEAIAWALYGNDRRILRDGKSGVKYSGAQPSEICSVELDFEIAGENYHLVREMRGRSGTMVAEISQNGMVQASTDGDVRDFVEKTLGMDAEGFLISVFARQKELNALSELTPEKRKRKIESMLGLDAIDEARKMIASDKNRMKDTIDGMRRVLYDESGNPVTDAMKKEMESRINGLEELKSELISLEKREKDLSAMLENARKRMEELREKEKRFLSIKSEMEGTERRISEKREMLESRRSELRELRKKEETLKEMGGIPELLRTKEEELEGMRSMRESSIRLEELRKRKAELEGRAEKIRKWLEKNAPILEDMEAQLGDLKSIEKLIEDRKKELESINEEEKRLFSEIEALKKEIEKLKKSRREIESLGPESRCPTCHRPLGEDYRRILDEIGAEISEKEGELAKLEKTHEKLKEERNELKNEIEEMERERERLKVSAESLRSKIGEKKEELADIEDRLGRTGEEIEEIGDVKFDSEEYEELKKEVESLRRKNNEYSALKAKVERIPSIESEIRMLEEDISELEKTLRIRKDELESLSFSKKELDEAVKEHDRLTEEVKSLHGSIRAARARVESEEKEIKRMQGEIEDMEKKMAELREMEEDFRYLAELEGLMKDFRTRSISSIRPALESIASEFFRAMTDGKYPGIEIGEDYSIKIIDAGKSYPIERFSGGESDLANLCLRLAISEVVVRARGARGFNFLVLDEIFGSQDTGRRENILRALQSLQNRFSQIFLISHIEGIKESASMVIRVEETQDGSSRVYVE